MNLIIFVLVAYGFSNIIVHGKIFNNQRDWLSNRSKFFNGVLHCMMCSSTWVGFILSILLMSPSMAYCSENPMINFQIFGFYPVAVFFDGLLASGGVWLIHTLQEYLEYNTPQEE